MWNRARRLGMCAYAKELKGCRFAIRNNPENLRANGEVGRHLRSLKC